MAAEDGKKILHYRDLFVGDFWRYFVRAAWLFFPAILFLLLAYMCFWQLSQGKDLMIITLENRKVFGLFLLALVFWVYITWYSSRLVAKAKEFEEPDNHPMWLTLRIQGPRILAFTCITIIILAFFQLPYPETPKLSKTICIILFWLSFSWYFFIYQFWNWYLKRRKPTLEATFKFWHFTRVAAYILLTVFTLLVVISRWTWGLIGLLIAYQVCLVLLILIRRNIIEAKGDYSYQNDENKLFLQKLSTWKKIRLLVTDREDRLYFKGFNIISSLAAIVYLATVFSVRFSTWMGPFPFVLLAFGVLLGLGNFVAVLSVLARFNFHLLFITIAFLLGYVSEPHYVRLINKQNVQARFDQRQNLKEFFYQWINDPERKKILNDTAIKKYPVYFCMANGGASRSGYWSATVFSKIEDETKGLFSKHLFCLSGASGGSVGNATFFSILRSKNRLTAFDQSGKACQTAAAAYLKSDFLTYTLARMLGPDVFRNLITLYNVNDRASALSLALEQAAGKRNFLYDSLAVPFSNIITQRNQPYGLPILCINTTRMQDGSPAIISNINISDTFFNKRIDVLGLLDERKDFKLSNGVVLGASFPYISPAGRIDYTRCDTCKVQPNYFVDGGYFDNSGAGAVFEMIFSLQQFLAADPFLASYKEKVEFNVLHITNDPAEEVALTQVNPFVNDLAAPVKTLLGAYGTQTSVNDFRLKKYMSSLYNDSLHYTNLSLYKEKDSMTYTMNWVISNFVLDAMNKRLNRYERLNKLIIHMQETLR
ncbi:MAG: hypothetical protein JSS70_01220 [Bacteroidetes bacterium]|nr:hypothetical protein [Bacteroidota bacterium]